MMNIITKKIVSITKVLAILIIFLTSISLGIHNAALYKPAHGFDGIDHVFYIKYLVSHGNIPPPILGKETHQPPLYYVLAAILTRMSASLKNAQYINVVIFFLIILMVGLGLHKVFKDKTRVMLGMYALVALPMLNIFPPMVTNELLNTLWIISAVLSLIYLVSVKEFRRMVFFSAWFLISFILGFWTKVSILTVLPTALLVLIILLLRFKSQNRKIIMASILLGILMIISTGPILIRDLNSGQHSSNLIHDITFKSEKRTLDFYYRVDWIPKVDMYNAQYYSMIGGAWNSFWSDGQNAITPFVSFHKKALILWLLGFVLFAICLYGLVRLQKKNKDYGMIINFFGFSTLAFFVYFNTLANHYSSARLTYVMGVILTYAFGIASAATSRRSKTIIFLLLTIQFFTMVSFYWILPWWFDTK